MLAIRMQRTGRKGHAMFRVIVQESRLTPTSGKVVALLGSYDPHAKTITLNKDKAGFYLEHGAQPSERVTRLLQAEGLKLPKWVASAAHKQSLVRHADKRRSSRPPAVVEAAPVAAPAAEPVVPDQPEADLKPAEAATEAAGDQPAKE